MSAERREAATPKRRAEARRRGEVARSDELTRIAVLVALAALLTATAASIAARFAAFVIWTVEAAFTGVSPGTALTAAFDLLVATTVPLGAIAVLTALLTGLMQVGPVFALSRAGRPAQPSMDATAALTLDAGRAIVVVLALGYGARSAMRGLLSLPRGTMAEALSAAHAIVLTHAAAMALALLGLALADLAWRRWAHGRDLRMSRREHTQEARDAEPSPQIRAQQKRRHQNGPAPPR